MTRTNVSNTTNGSNTQIDEFERAFSDLNKILSDTKQIITHCTQSTSDASTLSFSLAHKIERIEKVMSRSTSDDLEKLSSMKEELDMLRESNTRHSLYGGRYKESSENVVAHLENLNDTLVMLGQFKNNCDHFSQAVNDITGRIEGLDTECNDIASNLGLDLGADDSDESDFTFPSSY